MEHRAQASYRKIDECELCEYRTAIDVDGGGAYHIHVLSRTQAAMGDDMTVLTVQTDPTILYQKARRLHGESARFSVELAGQ